MTELSAILDFAQKLNGVTAITMFIILLYALYQRRLMFGRDCLEMKADYERRLAKAEERADKYEAIATRAVGLGERSVGLAELRSKNS